MGACKSPWCWNATQIAPAFFCQWLPDFLVLGCLLRHSLQLSIQFLWPLRSFQFVYFFFFFNHQEPVCTAYKRRTVSSKIPTVSPTFPKFPFQNLSIFTNPLLNIKPKCLFSSLTPVKQASYNCYLDSLNPRP